MFFPHATPQAHTSHAVYRYGLHWNRCPAAMLAGRHERIRLGHPAVCHCLPPPLPTLPQRWHECHCVLATSWLGTRIQHMPMAELQPGMPGWWLVIPANVLRSGACTPTQLCHPPPAFAAMSCHEPCCCSKLYQRNAPGTHTKLAQPQLSRDAPAWLGCVLHLTCACWTARSESVGCPHA